jgi:hypothetical protein
MPARRPPLLATASRRRRALAIAALVAAFSLGTELSASAPAAGPSTLKLMGSHSNVLGTDFKYVISGYAAAPADRVIAWYQFYQRRGCASTYAAERARAGSAFYELAVFVRAAVKPNASYSETAWLRAYNRGTHGICAYLYDAATGTTYAHAGAWWNNHAA